MEEACEKLQLDGLILIGGSVSNSDTAMLADHFAAKEACPPLRPFPRLRATFACLGLIVWVRDRMSGTDTVTTIIRNEAWSGVGND